MPYSNSNLVSYKRISPNRTSPRNHVIDRITPHCYVGQVTVEDMGAWLCNPNAKASANYGIGRDGRVALLVEEKDRSWCSSSSENDNRAVTIECASDRTDPYAINDVVYNKLVDLMEDICRRNGKTVLLWLGDKTRTVQYSPAPNEMLISVHRWWANKACPGNFIFSRLTKIATEVTRRLGGQVLPLYRVRLAWDKPETQLGAYYDLNNAKTEADAHPGFSVYDEQGVAVYKSSAQPQPGEYTPEQWIGMIAPIAQEIARKYSILPSVVIPQTCLETGWGKTDLAKRFNVLGMKADLINSTWQQWSTWTGKTYTKTTPEYHNGQLVYVKDTFRVYDSFSQCLYDYAGFLLHVRNNKGLKYARLQGLTDPAKVIHIIRIGTGTDAKPEGYCTDPAYETKILNLISKYNLTQYDSAMPDKPQPAPQPTPQPTGTRYRVQIEADRTLAKAQETIAYVEKATAQKEKWKCFSEKGSDGYWRVFCGSFESKANAEERAAAVRERFRKENLFQGTFVTSVVVG